MLYRQKKTYKKKTHCKYGHEMTPENTSFATMKTGYAIRRCVACRRQADRERYMDQPEYAAAKRARAKQQFLEQCAELYS